MNWGHFFAKVWLEAFIWSQKNAAPINPGGPHV